MEKIIRKLAEGYTNSELTDICFSEIPRVSFSTDGEGCQYTIEDNGTITSRVFDDYRECLIACLMKAK